MYALLQERRQDRLGNPSSRVCPHCTPCGKTLSRLGLRHFLSLQWGVFAIVRIKLDWEEPCQNLHPYLLCGSKLSCMPCSSCLAGQRGLLARPSPGGLYHISTWVASENLGSLKEMHQAVVHFIPELLTLLVPEHYTSQPLCAQAQALQFTIFLQAPFLVSFRGLKKEKKVFHGIYLIIAANITKLLGHSKTPLYS